ALARAASLADKLKLADHNAQRAALFAHDGTAQNFVELEGGGKASFSRLLAGDLYSPFWWEVRLFRPGETAEAHLRFKPDGTPYGFYRRVPESALGPALDANAAREIAETRAREDWNIDFTPYRLLEQSQVVRSGGRVDHSFIYERQNEQLGDGRFRLRLQVSGAHLPDLIRALHVTEPFSRHF